MQTNSSGTDYLGYGKETYELWGQLKGKHMEGKMWESECGEVSI